ncbi:formyltetrahydrofolate deformylase [Candidatus Nitronereus thalassa]|uniref:Formyltetrahydrofolate deformylase n=1 Tax=Candidatus Nitronereus thalassa TaxID=3020898 RepID=A0ABU3K737_9BACT|nr:formyltetrahydrofolate deformylase [Candidatus Nitronereus thalassa]MDT7042198.1 formyltetrahydrofolate deformylase [Candidatus Nitronereus thalassa]
MSTKPFGILLVRCQDQKGIVARVASFLHDFGGNIVDSDHHTDRETGDFLMRMVFDLAHFQLSREDIHASFAPIAKIFGMTSTLHFSDSRPRMALMVSKYEHCLVDLLQRQRRGELAVDIPMIISNHSECQFWADRFEVPYCHFPVTPGKKPEQEQQVLEVLHRHQVDVVVMARYMQILSNNFLDTVGCPVINIHHSFLPAFIGAKPYHQAYERGVKIIGATAHYATQDLDEGPIIEQDVMRIGHRDTIDDLVRKGRDLETFVLARAVRNHIEHRVLVYGKKTVIFD